MALIGILALPHSESELSSNDLVLVGDNRGGGRQTNQAPRPSHQQHQMQRGGGGQDHRQVGRSPQGGDRNYRGDTGWHNNRQYDHGNRMGPNQQPNDWRNQGQHNSFDQSFSNRQNQTHTPPSQNDAGYGRQGQGSNNSRNDWNGSHQGSVRDQGTHPNPNAWYLDPKYTVRQNGGERFIGNGAYIGPNQPGYYPGNSLTIHDPSVTKGGDNINRRQW